jgi:hypothetical protein
LPGRIKIQNEFERLGYGVKQLNHGLVRTNIKAEAESQIAIPV